MRCELCNKSFRDGDIVAYGRYGGYCCPDQQKCSERKTMSNIKITAEVDGKQVPLKTVSTETFEAIKALEKPKEIPVARWATYSGSPRLIFKPSVDIQLKVGRIYALDLRDGDLGADWALEDDNSWMKQY